MRNMLSTATHASETSPVLRKTLSAATHASQPSLPRSSLTLSPNASSPSLSRGNSAARLGTTPLRSGASASRLNVEAPSPKSQPRPPLRAQMRAKSPPPTGAGAAAVLLSPTAAEAENAKMLTDGLTREVETQNQKMRDFADKVAVEQRKAEKRLTAHGARLMGINAAVLLGEKEIERQFEGVTKSLNQYKNDLDGFVLLSPAERRQEMRRQEELATGGSKGKRLTRSDFQAYKFVRKIATPASSPNLEIRRRAILEAEDPPTPKSIRPVEIGSSVVFNMSPEAIAKYHPSARREGIEYRAREHYCHIMEVKMARRERQAQALADKIAAGQKASGMLKDDTVIVYEGFMAAQVQWIQFLVAAKFATNAAEVIKVKNMNERELLSYVCQDDQNAERLARFASQDARINNAIDFSTRLKDPAFRARSLMMFAMMHKKLMRHAVRRSASAITQCLMEWRSAGRLIVQIRSIPAKLVKVQRWYRECAQTQREVFEKVTAQWIRIEKADLLQRITSEDALLGAAGHSRLAAGCGTGGGAAGSALAPTRVQLFQVVPLEMRVESRMVSAANRAEFLSHELRARRYKLLPAMDVYLQNCVEWEARVQEWRELHKYTKSIGHLDREVFLMPPLRPSYLPSDAEVFGFLSILRRRPEGGGWTVPAFPKVPGGKVQARKATKPGAQRKENSENEMDIVAARLGVTEEEMKRRGVDARQFPCFNGHKPKEKAGYGGPLVHSSPVPTPRGLDEHT